MIPEGNPSRSLRVPPDQSLYGAGARLRRGVRVRVCVCACACACVCVCVLLSARGHPALSSTLLDTRKVVIRAGSTLECSQAVPHPSTNWALCRLTSEVRRDLVHSTRYGRQRQDMCQTLLLHLGKGGGAILGSRPLRREHWPP